jgi:phosphoglycolate phosphatase
MPITHLLQKLHPYKHIIWDWNGTLLDDLHITHSIIQEQMKNHGVGTLSLDEYRDIFQFPIQTFYRKLNFDFNKISFEALSQDFGDKYRTEVTKVQLFQHTGQLLTSLKAQGKDLALLSASEKNYLHEMTSHFQVRHFFDHLFGLEDSFAHSKVELGLKLMVDTGFHPENTVLVGDTTHDYEVGSAMGVAVFLIADGYQNARRLRHIHPLDHHVLDTRHNQTFGKAFFANNRASSRE